jgi:hypothetical protein
MNKQPLTLNEAMNICRHYQHLNGNVFDKKSLGKGYIECIAVAPFEESKQWLFAQYYHEFRNPNKALQFYNGKDYDVIVLSIPVLRKRGIHYQDLRSYLSDNNVSFARQRQGREEAYSRIL